MKNWTSWGPSNVIVVTTFGAAHHDPGRERSKLRGHVPGPDRRASDGSRLRRIPPRGCPGRTAPARFSSCVPLLLRRAASVGALRWRSGPSSAAFGVVPPPRILGMRRGAAGRVAVTSLAHPRREVDSIVRGRRSVDAEMTGPEPLTTRRPPAPRPRTDAAVGDRAVSAPSRLRPAAHLHGISPLLRIRKCCPSRLVPTSMMTTVQSGHRVVVPSS